MNPSASREMAALVFPYPNRTEKALSDFLDRVNLEFDV